MRIKVFVYLLTPSGAQLGFKNILSIGANISLSLFFLPQTANIALFLEPLRLVAEDPPGAQVVALFEVADDAINGAGWREDVFRVAAVITGSHFAEPSGFDSQVCDP